MASYKRKQADSLFIDIPFKAWKTIDDTWVNWTGLWTIRASLDTAVILSGTLSRSDTAGTFNLRIGPVTTSGWATLPVGQYVLTIEINNATADFRIEDQPKLTVTAQGVPNV